MEEKKEKAITNTEKNGIKEIRYIFPSLYT